MAKEYASILIGTGSAMSLVNPIIEQYEGKIAVIDKDEPGGICLTRGCIPSKNLLHPADLVREIQDSHKFGIQASIQEVDFQEVMDRMHSHIDPEIASIERSLSESEIIDYYREPATFVEPYTLEVGDEIISADQIFLCTGSKPLIPPIKGLREVDFLTSRSVLDLEAKPESLIVLGGGYIGMEYAHFFSAMGTEVTVVEMKSRVLPSEEPEISSLLQEKMEAHMDIITEREVVEVDTTSSGDVEATTEGESGKFTLSAEQLLVASGRAPNTDILDPDKGGIETDSEGWIEVDPHLETSQDNIWALGDATGKHMFKHVANYEARVVYHNAILGREMTVNYHAVPHAIFTYPEVAAVGMREREAISEYGKEDIALGFEMYEDTAKGEAMGIEDCLVKVIIHQESDTILGAHIIGPQASILIQEIVNLMYTEEKTSDPITEGMHIHPALSEVVERAFFNRVSVDHYHHHI